MSKVAKKKKSEERRRLKSARKKANYLRYGPKADHMGKRQKRKRFGTFKQKKSKTGKDSSPTPSGVKAKRKRQGLSVGGNKKCGVAKFPLKPLRKRKHLNSGDIGVLRGKK